VAQRNAIRWSVHASAALPLVLPLTRLAKAPHARLAKQQIAMAGARLENLLNAELPTGNGADSGRTNVAVGCSDFHL
jgi:hypothetical protein